MNDKYILDSNASTTFSRKLSIQNIKLRQISNYRYGLTNLYLRQLHYGLSSDKIACSDKFLQYQDYV